MRCIPCRSTMLLAAIIYQLPTCSKAEETAKVATKVEFYAAYREPAEGLVEKIMSTEETGDKKRRTVYLDPKPAISNNDIQDMKAGLDPEFRPVILVLLTESGGAKMKQLSMQQLDKLIAIVINGEVVTAPTVRSEIGRECQITGFFKEEWVEKIVAQFHQK